MNWKAMLFCTAAALLAISSLQAREKSDIVVMNNGDKITCEIKSLSSDTLYINVDYMLGTISVDWTKVAHIESKQLFLVKTQDGTIYTGKLSTPESPSGRPLQIEVLEPPGEKVTLDQRQVVNVDETSTSKWQRLNGQVGLGFTYTKGNQASQYNLNSNLNYVEERWSTGANYTSTLASSAGSSVSTRNELSLTAQHLMPWNNWFYAGLGDILQSSVLGVQQQYTLGAGVGRDIKNTGSTFFSVYGGFAWQQIHYQQQVVAARTQQVSAGFLGTELKLFRFNKTTLTLSATLLPALSDPGRVHFNLNSSYYVKLWGKLNWNFTVYGNWDNHPPPGFVGSDYGASSGFSISFGGQ
jgi:Protein of unknown function, DUF481